MRAQIACWILVLTAGCNSSEAHRDSAMRVAPPSPEDPGLNDEDPSEGGNECPFRAVATKLDWSRGWHVLPESGTVGVAGRTHFAQLWTGNELFVFGGLNETGIVNDGAVLYPDSAKSVWKSLPTSPLGPRVLPVAAWTGKEVVVWGGETAFHGSTPIRPASDGASFNPCDGTWSRLPDGPLPAIGAQGVWVEATHELLILGYNETGSYAAAYAPNTKTWRTIGGLPGFVAAMVPSVLGTHVVFLGDGANPEPVSPQGYDYDVVANTWKPIDPPVNNFFPRLAARFPGQAGFFGEDFDGSTFPPKEELMFRAYRVTDGTWTRRAGPSAAVLPQGRDVETIADGNRYFFGYGGQTSFEEANAAIYEKASDTWKAIPKPGTRVRLNGVATWANDVVILYGGFSWGKLEGGFLSDGSYRADPFLYRP